jgi:hypothetical protein
VRRHALAYLRDPEQDAKSEKNVRTMVAHQERDGPEGAKHHDREHARVVYGFHPRILQKHLDDEHRQAQASNRHGDEAASHLGPPPVTTTATTAHARGIQKYTDANRAAGA